MARKSSKEIFADTIQELAKAAAVDKITVKQIVEKSGLSLQTFYNHFKDKSELILYIHKSAGDSMIAKLGKDGYGYRELTEENIRFYIDHKDFFYNALTNTYGLDSYAEQCARNAYTVWTKYLTKKKKVDKLPEDIDFLLKMYCFAFTRMIAEWAFRRNDISPERFIELMNAAMPGKLRPYLLKA
ncbi:MAG: TetR/AcrR family transcriptional regulator C-terminal domain-containing protein [Ruminococcus sp.]|nr:TetR/AcrR family transcriptional regulator C-terminal domain-containing protein [Ruminococcus sp.]